MKDKRDMSEMSESEISYRKFLKNLGVTTHKELENLIKIKIDNGKLVIKESRKSGLCKNPLGLQEYVKDIF